MKKSFWLALYCLSATAAPSLSAQGIQINRQNRTVSASATETVEVEPDIAELRVGYYCYGLTQDAAYNDNGRIAAKVIAALHSAGVRDETIETQAVSLARIEQANKDWTPEQQQQRQFTAHQVWTIRVSVAEAQRVVDLAVAAGANEVQGVTWTVADANALEAKANAAAVAKARKVAEGMAQQLGGKLGDLLYASNSAAPYAGTPQFGFGTGTGFGAGGTGPPASPLKPILELFPQKVRRSATVYAVFALE